MTSLNASCEACHTEIAAEWRGSLHQLAYVEPAYQRALAREPLAWCRRCHAPEADARSEPSAELAQLGVGCVTCHLVDDQILAGTSRNQDATPAAAQAERGGQPAATSRAHPVLRTLSATPAGACQSCHEFSFPDTALRATPLLMQSTVSEHAQSAQAAQTCADCHMPLRSAAAGHRPHRDHRFLASRDPESLRAALVASAQLVGDRLRVVMHTQGVGHAFPTGDLFRRLEVGAEIVGDDYRVLSRHTELLTREFNSVKTAGISRRELVSDTRIDARTGTRVVELPLAARHTQADARSIAWWVSYQRVAFPRAGDQEAEIEGDVTLASGLIPLVGAANPLP